MANPKDTPESAKKELRFLFCKKCNCEIDEVGCSYECEFDGLSQSERKPEDMGYLVYVFNKVEPFSVPEKS